MTKNVAIRDLDEETFRKFRAAAVEENVKLGEAVSMAMKKWLAERRNRIRPDPKNFLKLKGFIKPGKRVRWSEEVDEIVYG